ncbi:N-6 DNA methylase [Vibrio parahaemolyticus]|uniref:N-6 DNA methylase n=1 Tax=Vibrio parahaemolyticus TaxID=670 RepID=UPI0023626AC2|nr:N-6 DNA methylase [Vibrio parahaemolyticus]
MQRYKHITSDKLGRYYTKHEISLVLRDALSCRQAYSILDLGSGEGALSLPLLERFPYAKCVTVDIDAETAFPKKYKNHTHYNKDVSDPQFLVKNKLNEANFDISVCNPPFINVAVNEALKDFLIENGYPLKLQNRKNISAEIIFVIHSINALASGGKLGLIVPDGFISGEKYKHFREYLSKQGTILNVIKLPRNAFEKTDVQAHVLIFIKKFIPVKIKLTKYNNGKLGETIEIPKEIGLESLDYDINVTKRNGPNSSQLTLEEMSCLISRGKHNSKQCKELSMDIFHNTHFQHGVDRVRFKNININSSKLSTFIIAKKGDILISRVGKNISSKIAIVDSGCTIISDCILRIRPPDRYKELVFNYLTSSDGRKKIDSHVIGASARYITKSSLLKISIPIEEGNDND